MKNLSLIIATSLTLLLSGCAQVSPDEKSIARAKIDKMANLTIKTLAKNDASISTSLKKVKGYAVVNWKVTKVPVVGAGGGNGVIVDQRTGERTYIKVGRFDIGGGWGARSYKNLILINNEKILDKAKIGSFKFEAGAEVAAGKAGVDGGSSDLNKDFKTHMLLDGGGSATATVRFLYFTIDGKLN